MNKKIIIRTLILLLVIMVIFPNTTKKTYAYSIGDTLVDVVIREAGSNVGWSENFNGVTQTPEGDYRYVGVDVNNYVSFNNDLYRIIGVFDKNTHNQDGMLVKLVAENFLSPSSWGAYNKLDTNGNLNTYAGHKSDWTGNTVGVKANLNVLLNNYFYPKTNIDSTYGECEEWTYYSNDNNFKTKDCSDILRYGIDSNFRGYISDARWYLYGYNGLGFSKQAFYQCERGLSSDTTNCKVGGTIDNPYSEYTEAKIGLMYASDYLYASGYFSSTDETLADDTVKRYRYGIRNWLYRGYEWTITQRSGSTILAFYVSRGGYLSATNNTHAGHGYRPTFYLKSSVYYTGGSGTFDDPYTIACDDCAE